jgi:hypothetical protein
MRQFLSQTRYDNWIVHAALLPALLTLAGIGATTAIAWHNQTLWDPATLSTIRIDSDGDDYVQGLAKLGIVQLPGYHPQPALPDYEPPPALPTRQNPESRFLPDRRPALVTR